MHTLRKELCLRIVVMLAVLMGVGYHGITSMTRTVKQSAGIRVRPVRVKNVALPPDSQKELIADGISLVDEKGRGGQVAYLMPSLVEKKRGRVETAKLSMLVQGQKDQYAMINNRIYRKGDVLPDGREVVSMDAQGVVLSALGHVELLPWVPPLKIELKKSAPEARVEPEVGDGTDAVENPVQNDARKVVMDADKALKLLKKLETLDDRKN